MLRVEVLRLLLAHPDHRGLVDGEPVILDLRQDRANVFEAVGLDQGEGRLLAGRQTVAGNIVGKVCKRGFKD